NGNLDLTGEPIPTARDDVVPVGDDPASAAVKANDDFGSVAVVATHPSTGRIADFSFGGGLTYAPPHAPQDDSFKYQLFSAHGVFVVTATVQLPRLKLEIFNGQNAGNPVR